MIISAVFLHDRGIWFIFPCQFHIIVYEFIFPRQFPNNVYDAARWSTSSEPFCRPDASSSYVPHHPNTSFEQVLRTFRPVETPFSPTDGSLWPSILSYLRLAPRQCHSKMRVFHPSPERCGSSTLPQSGSMLGSLSFKDESSISTGNELSGMYKEAHNPATSFRRRLG